MVNVKQVLLSSSKYSIKSPYTMTPKFITVHNTANDASAKNEINYMNSNNNQVSYHYAVDDIEAIQAIPDNRNAWHCGDGRKDGNMKSIGVEICYSKSGGARYNKAEANSVDLVASLLKKHNLPLSAVKQHHFWSGKNCPHRIRANGSWDSYVKRIGVALDKLNAPAPKSPATPKPTVTPTNFRVKSGTYNTRKEAESAKSKVGANKIASEKYISIIETNGKFAFQTGTYTSEASAKSALQKMKKLKILGVGHIIKA